MPTCPRASRARSKAPRPTHLLMGQNRLDHLCIDAQNRVQRHHGVLKNHGNPIPPQLPQRFLVSLKEISSLEEDLPVHDAPGRIHQFENGKGRDGLAGPRFPGDPQHLSGVDAERNPLHGFHHAHPREKVCPEVFHHECLGPAFINRVTLISWSRGLSTSRSRSPTMLMLKMVTINSNPGKETDPVRTGKQVLVTIGDQQPERRFR